MRGRPPLAWPHAGDSGVCNCPTPAGIYRVCYKNLRVTMDCTGPPKKCQASALSGEIFFHETLSFEFSQVAAWRRASFLAV